MLHGNLSNPKNIFIELAHVVQCYFTRMFVVSLLVKLNRLLISLYHAYVLSAPADSYIWKFGANLKIFIYMYIYKVCSTSVEVTAM